jgi:alkaline phosphatase D
MDVRDPARPAACGNASPALFDPSRRRFLNRVSVAAGTLALAGTPLAALGAEGELHAWGGRRYWVKSGRRFFPQSIASFDPRPGSVLLWARAQDGDFPGQDLPLMLLVATDPRLQNLVVATPLFARTEDDGVAQIKLTGLAARTRYYFRFLYRKDGQWFGSGLGRTLTTPEVDDEVLVSFLVADCQDAIGRYYNSYFAALPRDLDFVLHVGDYIYETTGDPGFQNPDGRKPEFSDKEGAIELQSADGEVYYAAASISNYRELYQFYRSDRVLQRMHERFPFVNTWDDHEYSDDCWRATATYFDGAKEEADVQRRRNAERAFFEWIAVDDDLPAGAVDLAQRPLFPDTRLYREFRYGRNLHLVLTDYRSFRPDHLIAEDAFPGAIAVDKAGLVALLGEAGYTQLEPSLTAYVDRASRSLEQQIALATMLTATYAGLGVDGAVAAAKALRIAGGSLDAQLANGLIDAYNALFGRSVPPVTALDERGISFALMGKSNPISSLGARYLVLKDTYDLYAAHRAAQDAGSQDAYGDAQLDWLRGVLTTSDARWKVVANSTSLTSMVLDLTGETPGLPDAVRDLLQLLPALLRQRFYVNVDQFDGFPDYRRALLDLYSSVPGVVAIAGDIHASFATVHRGEVWEFTAPAVSSSALKNGVLETIRSDPLLSRIPGLEELVALLDLFLALGNREIRHVNTGVNGVVVMEAGADKLTATYWQIDGAEATTSYYDDPGLLAGKLLPKRIEVPAGQAVARAGPNVVGTA